MTWINARKLHNGDIVTVKATNVDMDVVEVEVFPSLRRVNVMLTDGNWYDHRDIR